MFYFFEKDAEYLRCELRATEDGWFDVRIHEPGFHERVERFGTYQAAHERWNALSAQFTGDGWTGPFSRE